MKNKKITQFFAAGMLLLSLCGCRNHLQTFESESLDYKRSEKPQITYRVKTLIQQDAPLMLQFDITEQKRTMVDTYAVRQTIERFTPYQGWRESYEILMGIGLLPVSLCSHILNVCTLGLFPYRLAAAVTNTSFAGMNPFLNIESDSRFEEIATKTAREKIDSKMEFQSTPAVSVPVEIKNNSGVLRTVSQNNGVARINMLDTKGFGPSVSGDREIKVYVAGSAVPCDTIVVERSKQRLIIQISDILRAYHKAPSGAALYKAVIELEKLKAPDLAFLLEKEEMAKNKNNSQFIKDFNSMIDKEKGKAK